MIDYSVSLKSIVDTLNLEIINAPTELDKIMVSDSELNRPGLQLADYYEFFDSHRIQIFGLSEISYLKTLSKEDYTSRITKFLGLSPVAVVITRQLEVDEEFVELAKKYNIPLFRTPYMTSAFTTDLNAFLNLQLAPRITRHGVLVEVYGEGILLLGESGVGKSETAIELIKRGHRLIADDAVEIRRVSSKNFVVLVLLMLEEFSVWVR